jgi:hypothetical protein
MRARATGRRQAGLRAFGRLRWRRRLRGRIRQRPGLGRARVRRYLGPGERGHVGTADSVSLSPEHHHVGEHHLATLIDFCPRYESADVVTRFEQGCAEGLERGTLRTLWRTILRLGYPGCV